MIAELLVLRLVHVLGGIFWVGSAVYNALFVMPALAGAGPAMGAVMAGFQRRRLFVVLPVVALLTMLSGLRLLWITSGGFSSSYLASPMGLTYTGAGLAAILSFVLGVVVARPAAARAGRLGQELAAAPDDAARARISAELDRVRRRGAVVGQIVVLLLLIAAAGMAVARYLG